MTPSSRFSSATDSDDTYETQTPKKLASWLQESHRQFYQAYQATTDSQKDSAILYLLDPDNAAYIQVSNQARDSDLLSTFLTYSTSEPKLRTLEKLISRIPYAALKVPISVKTGKGEMTLPTDSPLTLLVYLLPALTLTPDGLLDRSRGLRYKQKKAIYAVSDFFNALGAGMTDELIGKRILPTAANLVSDPSYLKRRDKRGMDPVIKLALKKLNSFAMRSLRDIFIACFERLVNIREARENTLYLSKGSIPSLQLLRTRSITYALLNIMNKETLTSTPGVYSLIAYLVSLSIGTKPESHKMLKAKNVIERVSIAIKLWEENKPESATCLHEK